MIPESIPGFLSKLEANNNRDWFKANNDLYQKAKADFELVTLKLVALINELDPSVGPLEPNECIFRIFRDTRFSNDKTPYKTNFGTYICKGGRKGTRAGYYLHIQPGQSFIACGLYMPEPDILTAVRNEIYHFADEYKSIIHHPKVKEAFGAVTGDKLVKAPKGFDPAFADIDLIKHKSFNLIKYYSDSQLQDKGFEKELKQMYGLMVPFNQFFNRVIDDMKG